MKETIDYKILRSNNDKNLQDQVMRLIFLNEGWELQGGVSITTLSLGTITYAQAMVKKKSE